MTNDFTGFIPPICTPLTSDGNVDIESLRDLIEFQLDAGATGIFVLGSSGEAIYLDDGERLAVAATAREAIDNRVPLLVGALAPTARRVSQQIAVLAGSRPDAFVATAPFYAQMSAIEIAGHFTHIANASPVPVLAYDIPGNIGYKLAPTVIAPLLKSGIIAGLKDSSGNLDDFSETVDLVGADRAAALLSGADTTALIALDAGADGLIPGLGNIRPDLFAALLIAHEEGAHDHAAALQRAIAALNGIFRIGQEHGLGRHASEIGGLKHILSRRGVIRATMSPLPLEPYPYDARDAADELYDLVERQLVAELTESSPSSKESPRV